MKNSIGLVLLSFLLIISGCRPAASATPSTTAPTATTAASTAKPTETPSDQMSLPDLEAFISKWFGAEEIRTVDISAFRAIRSDMTNRQALGILGTTKGDDINSTPVYFVKNGDTIFLLVYPFEQRYSWLDKTVDLANLTLREIGMTYADAAAKDHGQGFPMPTEEEIERIVVDGMKLDYLFTEYALEVDSDYRQSPRMRTPTTVDGKSGYFQVEEGQAYQTLDQLTTALHRYLTSASAQWLLDRKTYVMIDGVLYAQFYGGHGGAFIRTGQDRFIAGIDPVAMTIRVISLASSESGNHIPLQTTLRYEDGAWKIELPTADPG